MVDTGNGRSGWRSVALDLFECLAAFVLQITVLPRVSFPGGYSPDFLFLMLAYKALTRHSSIVLMLAAVFGLCADAMNPGELFGSHLLAKLPVLAALNFIGRSIPRGKGILPLLLAFTAGTIVHNLLLAILQTFKGTGSFMVTGGAGFISAVLTVSCALAGLVLHSLFKRGSGGRLGR